MTAALTKLGRALRNHVTYANVMSTIAVFGVLAGGGAYAAAKIGSSQIKKGAVDTKHLKGGAVSTKKLANRAVSAKKVADGAVGAKKLQATAVGTDKVADRAITTAKLDDGAVTLPKLGDDALGVVAEHGGSLISGRVKSIPLGGGGTGIQIVYGAASGESASAANRADVETLAPAVDGIATGLRAKPTVEASPTAGGRSVALVVNGAVTPLSCSASSPVLGCSSNQVVEVPAGAAIALRVHGSCAPPATCTFNPAEMLFGWHWRPAP